jgi:hypothetical protein
LRTYLSFCFIAAVSDELETTNETVDDPVSKYRALLQVIKEQEEKKQQKKEERRKSIQQVKLSDMKDVSHL